MVFDAKKIHIVGLGGIGTSALAKFLLSRDVTLSGSDAHLNEMTEHMAHRGVSVFEGHAAEQVPADTDLLIYSPAVPEQNPERVAARARGIQECSYSEALGELSKHYSTIVVTGTHGKSTTTAMLGLILEAAGYDPTVIVGSIVPSFADGNLRIGKGRYLVVEGCEHQANMLKLYPEMIVLISIEKDHLDYYGSLEKIKQTFQKFVDSLAGKGLVVVNADDPVSSELVLSDAVRYGASASAQYLFSDRTVADGLQTIQLSRRVPEEKIGSLSLCIPGVFNVYNALAATTAAMELGVPFEICARVLKDYQGIWRRFERVGTWNGHHIISDYGHHPTAIRATVQAARESFPGKKIILCFQPHQHSRTEALFDDFVEALQYPDVVIVPKIYRVEGRTETESVSSRHLVAAVQQHVPEKPIYYADDDEEAERLLMEVCRNHKESVVIVQGAGDIDRLARRLALSKTDIIEPW